MEAKIMKKALSRSLVEAGVFSTVNKGASDTLPGMHSAEKVLQTVPAFFFDMDGTLCNSEPLHIQAFYRALEQIRCKHHFSFNVPPYKEIHDIVFGKSNREAVDTIVKRYAELSPHVSSYVDLVEYHFHQAREENRDTFLIRPSVDLLKWLLEAKQKVCVVSGSTRKHIADNLSIMGVSPDLPRIGAEDYSHGKPNPEPYLTAARYFGIAPGSHCVVFEDSRAGVMAGVQAGMYVVGISSAEVPALELIECGAQKVVTSLDRSILPDSILQAIEEALHSSDTSYTMTLSQE